MKTQTFQIAAASLAVALSLAVAPAQATLETSKGRVVSSDQSTNSLVVKVENPMGQPTDMTFVLNGESKIVKGSGKLALADIAQGDMVTVNYRKLDGQNVVLSIGVEPQS